MCQYKPTLKSLYIKCKKLFTVRKLNLHNNVLTKLHVVCVKMFLKDCLAWLALGTQLIGSRLTTAT